MKPFDRLLNNDKKSEDVGVECIYASIVIMSESKSLTLTLCVAETVLNLDRPAVTR